MGIMGPPSLPAPGRVSKSQARAVLNGEALPGARGLKAAVQAAAAETEEHSAASAEAFVRIKRAAGEAANAGKLKEAVDLWGKAIEATPAGASTAATRCLRAHAALTLGQLEDALADANAALSERPTLGRAHLIRVKALVGLKRGSEADVACAEAQPHCARATASDVLQKTELEELKKEVDRLVEREIMAERRKAERADQGRWWRVGSVAKSVNKCLAELRGQQGEGAGVDVSLLARLLWPTRRADQLYLAAPTKPHSVALAMLEEYVAEHPDEYKDDEYACYRDLRHVAQSYHRHLQEYSAKRELLTKAFMEADSNDNAVVEPRELLLRRTGMFVRQFEGSDTPVTPEVLARIQDADRAAAKDGAEEPRRVLGRAGPTKRTAAYSNFKELTNGVFRQVDLNSSGAITLPEWLTFFMGRVGFLDVSYADLRQHLVETGMLMPYESSS